jgi:PAS domain S-box-containing protein
MTVLDNAKVQVPYSPPRMEAASIPVAEYRTLAELSSDFMFILRQGENGRYTVAWLSEGFARITGYATTNLPDINTVISAQNQIFIKNTLDKLNPGEKTSLDMTLQTQTGETCWLYLHMSCQVDPESTQKQILGIARDITEQKQSQQERENLTHKLQILNDIKQLLLTTNSLPDTLQSVLFPLKLLIPYTQCDIIEYDWLTEELHFIASTNMQHSSLVHENRLPLYFVDYPHYPPWHEVISIPDLTKHANLSPFQNLQQTQGIRSLLVAPLYAHETLFGYINIGSNEPNTFLPDQHVILLEIAHFIALRIQQSYLKHQQSDHTFQLEALVEQRTTDLKKLIDQLEESNRMKDEFLATISHELRTPLHVMLSKAEILQDGIYGDLAPKQQRAVDVIQEHGDQLLNIINNLLDITNLDANQTTLSLSQVDIELLCSQLSMATYRSAQKKRIKIKIETLAEPVKLVADESRLEQILLILLDNAIKFTPEDGKVGLDITVDRVQSLIHFDVWDTGIGIASDMLDVIFLPFKQLDASLSREYGGAGLGLPLAYRLTQLHDGVLSVNSEIGEGSHFTVSLPLEFVQISEEKNSLSY